VLVLFKETGNTDPNMSSKGTAGPNHRGERGDAARKRPKGTEKTKKKENKEAETKRGAQSGSIGTETILRGRKKFMTDQGAGEGVKGGAEAHRNHIRKITVNQYAECTSKDD